MRPMPALVRRATPAAMAQATNSFANFIVAVFVAHYLGAAALGTFAILFGILTTITALQTSWVGDSLTVLDRDDASIREGIVGSQLLFTLFGAVFGTLAVATIVRPSAVTALAFAFLTAFWLLEEFGRRALMARLLFGRLARSELTYLGILAAGIVVLHLRREDSLAGFIGVMAVAALAAYTVAAAALPEQDRLRLLQPKLADLNAVRKYGFWRAAQAGTGMFSMTAIRWIVAASAGTAVLGQLEIARLAVAPLFTLIAACANFVLPTFASRQRRGEGHDHVVSLTLVLLAAVAVYAAFVLPLAAPITGLIGGHATVTTAMVGEWLAVAAAVAAFSPATSLALVVGRPSLVFGLNFAGSVVVIVAASALAATNQAQRYPLSLMLGSIASGAAMLWVFAKYRSSVVPRSAPRGAARALGGYPPWVPSPRRRNAAVMHEPLSRAFDPRQNSLNALRLLLAASVIVSHCWPIGGFGGDPMIGKTGLGKLAVYAFFAISGFLITRSRDAASSGARYLWHRVLRIYPGYWICLLTIAALAAPLSHVHDHRALSRFPLAAAVTYVGVNAPLTYLREGIHGTLTGAPLPGGIWNGSLWSLSYEFMCYLAIGFLAWRGLLRRGPVALCTFAGVAVLVFHLALPQVLPHIFVFDVVRLLDVGLCFAAGSLLYLNADRIPMSDFGAVIMLSIAIVGFAAFAHPAPLIMFPVAYLSLWLSIRLPFAGRFKRNDISYGVYIYAFPIQQLLSNFGMNRHGLPLYMFLSLTFVVPVAAASWLFVERNAMRLRDWHPRASGAELVRADVPGVVPSSA